MRNRYRDNFRPSSTANRRSRGYGPHRRWWVAEELPIGTEAGPMGPTSEGAEAAAASSCRVVAVAVRIVGSLVGPCRRVQPASSSSISNTQKQRKKEREKERTMA